MSHFQPPKSCATLCSSAKAATTVDGRDRDRERRLSCPSCGWGFDPTKITWEFDGIYMIESSKIRWDMLLKVFRCLYDNELRWIHHEAGIEWLFFGQQTITTVSIWVFVHLFIPVYPSSLPTSGMAHANAQRRVTRCARITMAGLNW